MFSVQPIFAYNTLNHIILVIIFRIGIRSATRAVEAGKVVIVFIVHIHFRNATVEIANVAGIFGSSAIASEMSLGVKFDDVVVIVTGETARQTDAGLALNARLRVRSASQTRVQSLTFNITL